MKLHNGLWANCDSLNEPLRPVAVASDAASMVTYLQSTFPAHRWGTAFGRDERNLFYLPSLTTTYRPRDPCMTMGCPLPDRHSGLHLLPPSEGRTRNKQVPAGRDVNPANEEQAPAPTPAPDPAPASAPDPPAISSLSFGDVHLPQGDELSKPAPRHGIHKSKEKVSEADEHWHMDFQWRMWGISQLALIPVRVGGDAVGARLRSLLHRYPLCLGVPSTPYDGDLAYRGSKCASCHFRPIKLSSFKDSDTIRFPSNNYNPVLAMLYQKISGAHEADVKGTDSGARLPEADQRKEREIFFTDVIAWYNHSKLRCKVCSLQLTLALLHPIQHIPTLVLQDCGKSCKRWSDNPGATMGCDDPDVWSLQRKFGVLYHQPSNICGVVCTHCNSKANSNEAKGYSAEASATTSVATLEEIKQWYAGHGGPAAHAAENRPCDNEFAEWAIDDPQKREFKCDNLPSEEIARQLHGCFMFLLRHPAVGPQTAARICKATVHQSSVERHWVRFTKLKNVAAITDADVDDYLAAYKEDPWGRKKPSPSKVVIRRISHRHRKSQADSAPSPSPSPHIHRSSRIKRQNVLLTDDEDDDSAGGPSGSHNVPLQPTRSRKRGKAASSLMAGPSENPDDPISQRSPETVGPAADMHRSAKQPRLGPLDIRR
jgi:hypothetical protein